MAESEGVDAGGGRMIKQESINIKVVKTDNKCQKCKKDWTKCGRCPVMMKWVKEHKSD